MVTYFFGRQFRCPQTLECYCNSEDKCFSISVGSTIWPLLNSYEVTDGAKIA